MLCNVSTHTVTHDPLNFSGFRIPIAFIKEKTILKKELLDDLEIIHGEHPLYETFLNADDEFKKLIIPQLSKWYTTNVLFLKETQKIIVGDIPVPPDYTCVMELRKNKLDLNHFKEKYNYIEWEKLQFINKNPQAMQYLSIYNICSPILSLALPLFMLIIPFFMIRLQGVKISLNTYYHYLQIVLMNHSLGQIFYMGNATWDKRIMIIASFLFYIIQIYFNAQSCIKFVKNMTHIHENIFAVREYLSSTLTSIRYIHDVWNSYSTYKPFLENCKKYSDSVAVICKELDQISPLRLSFSKLSDIGKVMRVNYMLHMEEEWKETIDFCIYYNSYMHSMNKIKTKIEERCIHYCKFGETTQFKKLYYPHINSSDVVTNNIQLKKNIIITGPNASGKTTILKSVMISTILCQQFGCGFFSKATVKPYDILSSYINIPDSSGRESLFQAEACRCKHILDDMTKYENKTHLCIFDELFSGTNPYEAIGAATSYLKYISKKKNVSFILTTHFLDLCKRLNECYQIRNMQMQIETGTEEEFLYMYKIVEGISQVKGGIKVLTDMGYPLEIIEESKKIISEITF